MLDNLGELNYLFLLTENDGKIFVKVASSHEICSEKKCEIYAKQKNF